MTTIRDGDWVLFSFDPRTGRSVWRLEHDGKVTYRTDYPVSEIVKQNAEARHNSAGNRFGDYTKVASIPLNVLWDDKTGLIKAFDQHDREYLSRWLNDSENRAFRTFEGKV